MANAEQLSILRKGVEAWNRWRAGPNESADLDLSRANLRGLNCNGAVLYGVDLSGADLDGVSFNSADFSGADLRGARLARTNLSEANLLAAKLTASNLTGALLWGTNFNGTTLDGADLTNAILSNTIFADVDLSSTKGLDSLHHFGPSTVGIDTIFRSRGEISDLFLRSVGVPDSFIAYAKSLVGSGVEFYSCFISYSTKDQPFAERLHADLRTRGVRCWFAPHHIQGGRKIHEQIDEAIRLHDKLLLILSPHSMASEWVMTEISKARKREIRDGARVLFSISLAPFATIRDWECFDADTGKDSAREIRECYIPDFTNWKDDDSYQKAFERLLKDLRASSNKSKAG